MTSVTVVEACYGRRCQMLPTGREVSSSLAAHAHYPLLIGCTGRITLTTDETFCITGALCILIFWNLFPMLRILLHLWLNFLWLLSSHMLVISTGHFLNTFPSVLLFLLATLPNSVFALWLRINFCIMWAICYAKSLWGQLLSFHLICCFKFGFVWWTYCNYTLSFLSISVLCITQSRGCTGNGLIASGVTMPAGDAVDVVVDGNVTPGWTQLSIVDGWLAGWSICCWAAITGQYSTTSSTRKTTYTVTEGYWCSTLKLFYNLYKEILKRR